MNILDDEIIERITYSPECQATFKKYKGELKERVTFYTITLILLVIITPIAYNFFASHPQDNGSAPLVWLVIGAIMGVVAFGHLLNVAQKDLKYNKLDITTDVFVNIKMQYNSSKNNNSSYYVIELENVGTLSIPPKRIRRIEKGTEVYVIRTGISKTLLDIIPVNLV